MVEKKAKKSSGGKTAEKKVTKGKPAEKGATKATKKEPVKKTAGEKPAAGKKSRKKLWVILGSVFGGLVAAGLIIWGIVVAVIENQPLEQDWAQTYYVYLDENKLDPELKDSDGEVHATADEYSVEFYDVEGVDEPVMAVNYIDDDESYLTYYWIGENGNIGKAYNYTPSEVVLLYNIENKQNNYYIHYTSSGADYYKSLRDEILSLAKTEDASHVSADPEYKFGKDDVTAVKDKDGKEYTMTKFEQTFVEVEDAEGATVLPVDYDGKQLKETLKDESYEYKVLEEIAQKHADMINQAVADIEERKSEIARVEKENAELEAQRKAAEEAKRKAEEAAKGIQLEGYTIAYGTYLLDDDFIGPTNGEYTLVLKPNGVCTYGGRPCTWTIGERDYAQDVSTAGKHVHKSIFVRASNGSNYGTSVFAYGNNELGDGDIEHYTYAGY